MNKRRFPNVVTAIGQASPWAFLALTLVSGVICITALRANNKHMIKLRDAVYAADQNNGDVKTALKNLQAYVTSHMNTNLSAGPNAVHPPIQLKYTYERLLEAKRAGQGEQGSQLYTEAQHYCEQQNSVDFSGRNRVPCIEQYVTSHGGTVDPSATVPDSLYKFDFASPAWSPDLAGWTLLLTVALLALFVVTALWQWLLPRFARGF